MDKEKVTEELVRQNGNQAAAVMADYAGQGGGGGQVVPNLIINWAEDESYAVLSRWPQRGDILLVPLYGVGVSRRLLQVYIDDIVPESELPDEELPRGLGYATTIGEVSEGGFISHSINGNTADWNLGLQRALEEGTYIATVYLVNK